MKDERFDRAVLEKACASFKKQYDGALDWAVVLGSGLSAIADSMEIIKEIPFGDIKGVPAPKVAGHGGKFVIAKLGEKTVALVQGRVHTYEGYTAFTASIAVGMLGLFGCKKIILTNAAGGVNESYKPGDIMALTDHINLLGDNPLKGKPEFIDMTTTYEKAINDDLVAKFGIKAGVYAAMPGPSYETPAEVRFVRIIGGDAVGMSTVPSAIMARYVGMKVVGLSLITNMAAGITGEALSHQEVLDTGKIANAKMIEILKYTMSNH